MQIRIEQIVKRLNVRSTKPRGVERLKRKISEIGYLPEKPVIVAPNGDGETYVLIDGNHRITALEALGIEIVEALVDNTLVTKALQLRRARLANEVSETVVPTTFVDDAELVWRLSGEGMKQTEIGGILGWGRTVVANYSRLKYISDIAWEIVTANTNDVTLNQKGNVTDMSRVVTLFTENLLRDILPLTPPQQLELVTDLARGDLNKPQFKKRAIAYKTRNEIKKHITDKLSQVPADFIDQRISDIDQGGYDNDWQTEDKPKIVRLIQAILDEWEQKSGTRLIFGDFETEVNEIPDQSIDLIFTDIPYNISSQSKITKVGQTIVNADFDVDDDWDTSEDKHYLKQLKDWVTSWERILKPGGSVISFCDKAISGLLWRLFTQSELKSKNIIVWERTNPHPSGLTRKNLISSVEMMVWAVKPGSPYTFNETDKWDRKNIIKASFCSGTERIKDEKEKTLHPTQKPLAILLPLIEVFSNRGDLVFDGFMGVGSTGEAAMLRGRKFIGIENNQKFFDAAKERLGS
jgi:site-specific DNA-methyltransferase (adenine-specific)/modification methylase